MQVSSLLPAALPSLFLKSLPSGGPASALAISVLPGLGPGWIFRAHLNALFHLVLSPPSRGPGEGPAASASLVKTPDLALILPLPVSGFSRVSILTPASSLFGAGRGTRAGARGNEARPPLPRESGEH